MLEIIKMILRLSILIIMMYLIYCKLHIMLYRNKYLAMYDRLKSLRSYSIKLAFCLLIIIYFTTGIPVISSIYLLYQILSIITFTYLLNTLKK